MFASIWGTQHTERNKKCINTANQLTLCVLVLHEKYWEQHNTWWFKDTVDFDLYV